MLTYVVLFLCSLYTCHSYSLGRGACSENKIMCQAGLNWRLPSIKCIEKKNLCDDEYDCTDGTDEKYCPDNYNYGQEGYTYRFVRGSCPENQVMCPNYLKCIHYHWICDGSTACTGISEELFCPYDRNKGFQMTYNASGCPEGFVKCRSGSPINTPKSITNTACIKETWLCDNVKDCNDNSDEAFCPYILPVKETTTRQPTTRATTSVTEKIQETTSPTSPGNELELTTPTNDQHYINPTLYLVVGIALLVNALIIMALTFAVYSIRKQQTDSHAIRFVNSAR